MIHCGLKWDFVGRNLGFAYMLPPTLSNLDDRRKDIWFYIKGRSFMTAMLLPDDPPGRLDAVVDMSYPGQTGELPFGQRPAITDDIKAAAQA
ncbi:hypothetical protein LTR56_018882 [Elasticomyces elasticus]|nr:hypothetical protein LTR56_018882 [Elasticomyces elasticus]KAK3638025.1 hypothetical protein LTR22_017987 [Elasticomyces elasticus]KAK5749863.1 hypothetical protein LTS12_020081 [Elasticomyces elasticus]